MRCAYRAYYSALLDCLPNKLDTHLVVERKRQEVSMSKQSSVKRWSAKRKQEPG